LNYARSRIRLYLISISCQP